MVNTNRHISFFSFTSFSHKENVLIYLHLTLAFLLKTLGTQFAAPPIFLFTMPISYQQNFNILTKQKYNYNFLQLCFYKKEYFVGFI
ncbi:MAG: hypothetical protein COW71_07055 [Ignavibacteriales bacterium CG18_big_fil_WC_8_21_14_2_50_31_20]|nr:MAG: hypothetical protein COW71_07055 [Ignavibacteriales bacterium CG18_big_fil_WC_8_21_14_2_50_31_20]